MTGHPNPLVNQTIDLLARRDLDSAGKVTTPENWLREARRRRWERHKHQLTPEGLADLLSGLSGARSGFPEAARRDYDPSFRRKTCPDCVENNGLVLVQTDPEAWLPCQHTQQRSA